MIFLSTLDLGFKDSYQILIGISFGIRLRREWHKLNGALAKDIATETCLPSREYGRYCTVEGSRGSSGADCKGQDGKRRSAKQGVESHGIDS